MRESNIITNAPRGQSRKRSSDKPASNRPRKPPGSRLVAEAPPSLAELTIEQEQLINKALACQINAEARTNASSPYKGKLVGIARGRVVAVVDTPEELMCQLRAIEPDPQRCLGVIADADYERVYTL